MFKQYLYIIAFYFCGMVITAQITSYSVISAVNIKILGDKILNQKSDDFVFHVLDSLTKTSTTAITAEGPDKQIYSTYIKNNQLIFKKIISGYETNLVLDTLSNNLKNSLEDANKFPFNVCDKSNTKFKDRIYACWADAKNGINNNDVYLTYSDNGGEGWMERILITFYPNHKQQFMPRLAIDQQTGYLYFLYYNQRNYANGNLTDVFLTVSKDGGNTFTDYQLNTAPIAWQKDVPYYTYFSLSIKNGTVYTTWLEVNEKKIHTIYSASLTDSILKKHTPNFSILINKESPYIYTDKTNINFSSTIKGTYAAYLYKATEPKFEMKVTTTAALAQGANSLAVDFNKLKLKKGTYVLMLYTKNTSHYVWIQEE